MFTGIVTHTGTVLSAEKRGDVRLSIGCEWKDLAIGESVAVNGVCLTVAEKSKNGFAADLSAETLARTAPRWEKGMKVNLERALQLSDRLSGHMVSGHVDGLAMIAEITEEGGSHVVAADAPPELSKFITEKGSVTLDGVSLTVNRAEGARFWVNIIPHTWAGTNLSERRCGDALNLEADMIARYVERLREAQA